MATYDFETGNTNPEDFPAEALAAAAARAIPKIARDLNVYPGKLGHPGLRAMMAARERDREGVEVDPETLLLTNGSMQGVTLVGEALARGGDDVVVMETLNYPGTINAYRTLGYDMVGVPVDGHGMQVEALDRTLEALIAGGRRPRFVYILPTYQNPTGFTMPRERRLALLEVVHRHDVVLVEDNCYGDVHFEGEKPPAFYALDPDDTRHIYLCSLSKIFAPGVRLGYVMAREPWLSRLLERRHDAGPNTLAAAIMTEYFGDDLWGHVERANRALKAKRDATLAALERSLGNLCSWSHPQGGLFIWVELPGETDMERLARLAEEADVAYADGAKFHIHGERIPALRLAFGFPTIAEIEEGVARLGRCIREAAGA